MYQYAVQVGISSKLRQIRAGNNHTDRAPRALARAALFTMARIKAGPVDEYISLLDKVQKEAQYQELDYTNTSPFTFYCLAAMQLPVILVLSYLVSPDTAAEGSFLNRFSYMGLFNMAVHWIGFAIAQKLGTVKYFDITEDSEAQPT